VFLPDSNIQEAYSILAIVKDYRVNQDKGAVENPIEFIQRMPYPPTGGKTLCKLVERALPKNAGRMNYVVITSWIFIGISFEYLHEVLDSFRHLNKMETHIDVSDQK
jgi:hypothetical protein